MHVTDLRRLRLATQVETKKCGGLRSHFSGGIREWDEPCPLQYSKYRTRKKRAPTDIRNNRGARQRSQFPSQCAVVTTA